ncbi:MAG: glycosyltransferase family 2 protein [Bacteroidales bacterium]|nr:glycosyltransferase family 2 protein [Bacteroidales bacterium]
MNKTASYDLTIVVPVYNEEMNIEELERVFLEYLPKAVCHACVLFVNDGSTDNSLNLIEKICNRNSDLFFISYPQNAGLSAAIKAGIDYTYSPYVGYIDADLQTTPEDFNLLYPHAKEYALVVGIRTNRKDSWSKLIQSKIANGFRRMMTGDTATDTGCPLKIMQTECAKKIPFFTGMHRFLPALITLQKNKQFKEIPVRHFPRKAGTSKFHLWNRLISPFMDCFAFRWMKKRYINYSVDKTNVK